MTTELRAYSRNRQQLLRTDSSHWRQAMASPTIDRDSRLEWSQRQTVRTSNVQRKTLSHEYLWQSFALHNINTVTHVQNHPSCASHMVELLSSRWVVGALAFVLHISLIAIFILYYMHYSNHNICHSILDAIIAFVYQTNLMFGISFKFCFNGIRFKLIGDIEFKPFELQQIT